MGNDKKKFILKKLSAEDEIEASRLDDASGRQQKCLHKHITCETEYGLPAECIDCGLGMHGIITAYRVRLGEAIMKCEKIVNLHKIVVLGLEKNSQN